MDVPTRPRVLCVDDDKDVADSAAELLRLVGFEVQVCHDGPTALAAARGLLPDVCLLDPNTPGMEGDELAARLRDQAGGRPVLFVAVTPMGSDECRRTETAGYDLHLLKPVDPHDLLRVVDELWQMMHAAGRPAARDDPAK